MNTHRVHGANPVVVRRRTAGQRRLDRRAEVAAFEAWQRRQAVHPLPVPGRRSRRG